MKNLVKLMVLLSLCAATLIPALSLANTHVGLLAALQETKKTSAALLKTTDKKAHLVLIAKGQETSNVVDAAFNAALAHPAPVVEKERLIAAKSIWEEIKVTRDTEVNPAILAGDTDKARQIARKVQKPRFSKLEALLQ